MDRFTRWLRLGDPVLESWRRHFEARGRRTLIKQCKPYKHDRHTMAALFVERVGNKVSKRNQRCA